MSSRPLELVLSRIGTHKQQRNGYLAHCPAHDDKTPSLDVTEGQDGTVLVKCFAGCSFDAIVSALKMDPKDFFPSRKGNGDRFAKEDADIALANRGLRPDTIRHFRITPNLDKQAWQFPLGKHRPKKFKAFPGRSGPKNWVPTGTPNGLYNVNPCKEQDEVFLVEGEPDVWITHQAGLKAFSFTGGASNVSKGVVEEVAKAGIGVVHVVYDHDKAGREGAAKVAAAFAEAGVKYTVRQWPRGFAPEGDVTTLYNDLNRDDARFREALKGLAEVSDPAVWESSASSEDCADSARENKKQEWPPLVPLHSPDLPVFPIHCLPPPFARYVRELANTTQTPLALAGSLVLAVLATASHGKYIVEAKPGHREPLNLFVAVVLDPGNRKSQVFTHVSHPLHEYEQSLADIERAGIVQRQTERGILEERLAKAKKQAASTKPFVEREESIREAVDIARDLEETPELHSPRLIVDDITPEKLAEVMAQQGGRISLLSAEGDVFSIMAGRYSRGQPNLDIYLKAHSGDSVNVDRLGRPSLHIPKPILTIGVAIQPTVLRTMARNQVFRGCGLVGRFLFAIPKSPLGSRDRNPTPMADDTRQAYHDRIQELLKEGSTRGPVVLHLSRKAQDVYFDFADEVEPKLAPSGELGAMTDWGGKVVGAAVRIAGLLHVAADETERDVGSETMLNAVELARYFIQHAKSAYGQIGADPALEGAKLIVAWFRREPCRKTFSKRDAFESHRRTYFDTVEDMDPCFDLLEEHAHIRLLVEHGPRRPGRPRSQTYQVHPDLLPHNPHNPHNPPSGGAQANSVDSVDSAAGKETHEEVESAFADGLHQDLEAIEERLAIQEESA